MCEDVERQYSAPIGFSDGQHAFAVPFVQPWCDEVTTGGSLSEKRGEIKLVELRAVNGRVLATLGESTDKHAAYKHVADMTKALATRGYQPLVPGPCTIVPKLEPARAVDGWPAKRLVLQVLAGGHVLKRIAVGAIARARESDVLVVSQVSGTKLVIWTRVPTCSGPPPGYFDKDDDGTCYRVDTPVIRVVDAKACAP